jgi:hypothetical protein
MRATKARLIRHCILSQGVDTNYYSIESVVWSTIFSPFKRIYRRAKKMLRHMTANRIKSILIRRQHA